MLFGLSQRYFSSVLDRYDLKKNKPHIIKLAGYWFCRNKYSYGRGSSPSNAYNAFLRRLSL